MFLNEQNQNILHKQLLKCHFSTMVDHHILILMMPLPLTPSFIFFLITIIVCAQLLNYKLHKRVFIFIHFQF